jgi:hypothetical protein
MSRLFYTGIFLILGQTSLNAQVTLTAVTSNPLPGDSTTFYRDNTLSEGGSGPNVIWDFSMLPPTSKHQVNYVASGGNIPPGVPLASYSPPQVLGWYFVYAYSNDSIAFVVEKVPMYSGYSCTKNPRMVLRYPLSYNSNTYIDSFHCTSGTPGKSITYDDVGSQVISADAYGTLILPDTTYQDILRVKKVITTKRTTTDPNQNKNYFTVVEEIYEWYSATASRTFLLQIGKHISTTDVTNLISFDPEISLYPNPASTHLIISLEKSKTDLLSIGLKSISGNDVLNITGIPGKHNYIMDVSNVSSGLYYLYIETRHGNEVRKIVVQ